VELDGKVNKWSVKTHKPGYEEPVGCQFNKIPVISSPQGFEADRTAEKIDSPLGSLRRNANDLLTLKCLIEPPLNIRSRNVVQWSFSKDDHQYSSLNNNRTDGITVKGDQLIIHKIKKTHRGHYRCSLNDISFTVLLRVKDRLAALWPFIGIVSGVLVLVVIILAFEKRQKSARKARTAEDDENDHAKDPLVRSSNKPSDNENKKRTVKA